jgi:hypothetical protein
MNPKIVSLPVATSILYHQSTTFYPVVMRLGTPEANLASKNRFTGLTDSFIDQLPFEMKNEFSYYGYGIGWIANELLKNAYDAVAAQYDKNTSYYTKKPSSGLLSFDIIIKTTKDETPRLLFICCDNGLGILSPSSLHKKKFRSSELYFGGYSLGHKYIHGMIKNSSDKITMTTSLRNPDDTNSIQTQISVEIPLDMLKIRREFRKTHISPHISKNKSHEIRNHSDAILINNLR